MAPKQPRVPRAASIGMKLAKTFSAMWPASMLANRRTECETGRRKNEKTSMNMTSGRIEIGTPEGTKSLKNFRPFL